MPPNRRVVEESIGGDGIKGGDMSEYTKCGEMDDVRVDGEVGWVEISDAQLRRGKRTGRGRTQHHPFSNT